MKFSFSVVSLLILANYSNLLSPTSAIAVSLTVEAISYALFDSYPDLLKQHYNFPNLQAPMIPIQR